MRTSNAETMGEGQSAPLKRILSRSGAFLWRMAVLFFLSEIPCANVIRMIIQLLGPKAFFLQNRRTTNLIV